MLGLLTAAVQETTGDGYSIEQILFVCVPIVVVGGVLLVLRKRRRG